MIKRWHCSQDTPQDKREYALNAIRAQLASELIAHSDIPLNATVLLNIVTRKQRSRAKAQHDDEYSITGIITTV